MEKYLKLERLDLDPSKPEAADTWRHWKTFNVFFEPVCETQQSTFMTDKLKLKLLTNLLSTAIYKHISDIHDYSTAMNAFEKEALSQELKDLSKLNHTTMASKKEKVMHLKCTSLLFRLDPFLDKTP